MIDYKLIGQRIKEYRQKAALTQETVAEQADITTVYLSKIENGHVKPTLDLLDRLCGSIGCELTDILTDVTPTSLHYQSEQVVTLFRACSPQVKPIALDLLKNLTKLK